MLCVLDGLPAVILLVHREGLWRCCLHSITFSVQRCRAVAARAQPLGDSTAQDAGASSNFFFELPEHIRAHAEKHKA